MPAVLGVVLVLLQPVVVGSGVRVVVPCASSYGGAVRRAAARALGGGVAPPWWWYRSQWAVGSSGGTSTRESKQQIGNHSRLLKATTSRGQWCRVYSTASKQANHHSHVVGS